MTTTPTLTLQPFTIEDHDHKIGFESTGDLSMQLRLGGATTSNNITSSVAVMLDVDDEPLSEVVVESVRQNLGDVATLDRAIAALTAVRDELVRLAGSRVVATS